MKTRIFTFIIALLGLVSCSTQNQFVPFEDTYWDEALFDELDLPYSLKGDEDFSSREPLPGSTEMEFFPIGRFRLESGINCVLVQEVGVGGDYHTLWTFEDNGAFIQSNDLSFFSIGDGTGEGSIDGSWWEIKHDATIFGNGCLQIFEEKKLYKPNGGLQRDEKNEFWQKIGVNGEVKRLEGNATCK